ncbi:uncharacterized protein [Argopecten irradians]|uniref:uncharacterized protein isoform X2 n=1 Tax=Argopecten irradians TaxID=31199 RepID=UPI0037197F18
MDAYLFLLTSVSMNKRIYHMETAVAKAIFEDSSLIHGGLRRLNLTDYDVMIGAVNESNSHWTLCAVYPKQRRLIYVNPLGETQAKKDLILMNWRRFLQYRYNIGIDSPPAASKWLLDTQCHIKQYDSVSCGIYVLKFAEDLLSDRPLRFKSAPKDILSIRLGIATQLLEISEPLDSYCRECCLTDTSDCLWIQCDSCPKWFHRSCVDIPRHKRTSEIQTNPYLCRFCLKDYEPMTRKRSSFIYGTPRKMNSNNKENGDKNITASRPKRQRLMSPTAENMKAMQKEQKKSITTTRNRLAPPSDSEQKAWDEELKKEDEMIWEKEIVAPLLPMENIPPFIWPQNMDEDNESDDESDKEGKLSMDDIEDAIPILYPTLTLLPSGKLPSSFHEQFMKLPNQRQTYGYGLMEIEAKALMAIEMWVMKTFSKIIPRDRYTSWSTVRGAEKELMDAIRESSVKGEQYTRHVILKETVTQVVQKIRKVTRKEAIRRCCVCEAESWGKAIKICMKMKL